jgi:hypothetical protein
LTTAFGGLDGDTLGAAAGIQASSHTHGFVTSGTGAQGVGNETIQTATVTNVQPTIILNYIIKT